MCNKVFGVIVIVVAVVLAVGASVITKQQGGLHYMVMMHRFFDIVLPVLGIGALLKFLFMSSCCRTDK